MLNLAHLARTDLNLLVLFGVVIDGRHVGRAAGRLNLTPSAVSHGLGRLRKLFNDPLFLRTPKGVVPTARALALREPVVEILARVQNVLGSAAPFDPAMSRRRFIVAAPDAVLASTTIPLLERISAKAPHVDVGLIHVMPQRRAESKEALWAGCLMMLENREIDLAMLPINQVPPRFEARRLYEEDFVVAMRKGHPFARAPTEAAFCAAEHLLVSLNGDPHGFMDEMLAKRGSRRRIVLTVPSFVMALTHLASSDLLAVLPRRLVRQHAALFGLIAVELPLRRKSDPIHAVVTRAAMMDAGIAWLIELFAELHIRNARTPTEPSTKSLRRPVRRNRGRASLEM
jgi:DNA-binding transcriptional LysR family regulator